MDEILFHAGIHPRSDTESLDRKAIHRLFDAIDQVVEGAVEARANPLSCLTIGCSPIEEAPRPRDNTRLKTYSSFPLTLRPSALSSIQSSRPTRAFLRDLSLDSLGRYLLRGL